jgi:hypothetical protein
VLILLTEFVFLLCSLCLFVAKTFCASLWLNHYLGYTPGISPAPRGKFS